ncbi:MAG: hypothetical protein OCD00_12235 [Colwellia sp.]
MKKLLGILFITLLSSQSIAASTVFEGVIEKSEVITTKVGKNGKPLLSAAVGVGIGSAFGSGSGKDAAKIAGGLIGARKAAQKKEQTLYGWRYIVKANDELHVIDTWCTIPNTQCTGVIKGKEVYVINGNEVSPK